MSIKKEELHKLVDKLAVKDQKTAYDFLKYLIDRSGKYFIMEADNDPLTADELMELEIAERQIENGEVINWEDISSHYLSCK